MVLEGAGVRVRIDRLGRIRVVEGMGVVTREDGPMIRVVSLRIGPDDWRWWWFIFGWRDLW